MNTFFAPLELKFPGDPAQAGTLEGYGSVFGNIDSYGDTIAPGAFKQSLAEFAAQGRKISMYMQHGFGDPRPVGVWDSVEEDGKGLYVKGRMLGLETETGKYHHALVKGGAVQGLSIGFRTVKADYPNEPGKPRRVIKELKLFEVSLVDQPANPAAMVASIKCALADIDSFAALEKFLRSEYRMSRSEAMTVISKCKAIDARDAVDGEDGQSDSAGAKDLLALIGARDPR